jgi:hypothetical protein
MISLSKHMLNDDPFSGITARFADFLAGAPVPALAGPKDPGRSLAFLVTDWHATSVPYFSILLGMSAALDGYRVCFLWDDQVWHDPEGTVSHNRLIGKVLEQGRRYGTVVRASRYEGPGPDGAEAAELARLADLNAHWKFRSPERTPDYEAFRKSLEIRYASSFPRARAALAAVHDDGFPVLAMPGGINGCTGHYLWTGRRLGMRVTPYDSGPGSIITGTEDIPGKLLDIAKVMRDPRWRPAAEDLPWIREEAETELRKRVQGTDHWGFQVVGSGAAPAAPAFDVLMPLNVMWDTAALGRHNLFPDAVQCVEETAAWLLSNTRATVAVRQHPMERIWQERLQYRNPLGERLALRFGSEPRLRYIRAEEAVNTYDLLPRAKVVVPATTTVGLEAVLLGIPVVTDCTVYYGALPGVTTATSRDRYFAAIAAAAAGRGADPASVAPEAWTYYYLSQKCWHNLTELTPQPEDFDRWVKRDMVSILADDGFRVVRDSLFRGIPGIYLNHRLNLAARSRPRQPEAAHG